MTCCCEFSLPAFIENSSTLQQESEWIWKFLKEGIHTLWYEEQRFSLSLSIRLTLQCTLSYCVTDFQNNIQLPFTSINIFSDTKEWPDFFVNTFTQSHLAHCFLNCIFDKLRKPTVFCQGNGKTMYHVPSATAVSISSIWSTTAFNCPWEYAPDVWLHLWGYKWRKLQVAWQLVVPHRATHNTATLCSTQDVNAQCFTSDVSHYTAPINWDDDLSNSDTITPIAPSISITISYPEILTNMMFQMEYFAWLRRFRNY